MMPQHHLPADIERTSMKIITGELAQRGLDIPPENAPVVKRVIHTTADFDYAQTLHFTPGAVAAGIAAMHAGVQAQKGYVKVKSEIGKGSTFSVFLPV